jgi:hypothetical protein
MGLRRFALVFTSRHWTVVLARSILRTMKSAQERRDKMIGVKVSDEEYERVRVAAFEARKSLAAYVRDAVLRSLKKSR